jgi:hypothetical protein
MPRLIKLWDHGSFRVPWSPGPLKKMPIKPLLFSRLDGEKGRVECCDSRCRFWMYIKAGGSPCASNGQSRTASLAKRAALFAISE